jgi:hypothetical protein
MHRIGIWLLAGTTAAALIATAAVARAQGAAMHELTIDLPGGGVEHVRYSGDVRPEIVMLPNAAEWADPFAAAFAQPVFWPDPAFAQLQQISASMDRQMSAMMERAGAMRAAMRSGRFNASFAKVPPGTVEFTQVSTWNGSGVCTRTTQMSEPGNGGKPQLVSNVSGDCGSSQAAPSGASGVIPAKAAASVHHAHATKA